MTSTKESNLKIMQGVTIGGDLGRELVVKDNAFYQPGFDGNIFLGVNSLVVGPVFFVGNSFVSANSIVSKFSNAGLYFGVNKVGLLRPEHEAELKIND